MTGGKAPIRQKIGDSAWLKAIKLSGGEHGSGVVQRKLWRVVSDYVRIRDFYAYGRCVATGDRIEHWKLGDAGHYIPFSKCNGIYKFDPENIHLQSKTSNGWGGADTGYSFGQELELRGYSIKKLKEHNRDTELKLNDSMVIDKIKEILDLMEELPEKPDYYARVRALSTDA